LILYKHNKKVIDANRCYFYQKTYSVVVVVVVVVQNNIPAEKDLYF